MAKTEAFDAHAQRYEAWFAEHSAAYQSELRAVRDLWPQGAEGIEIGAGAGHFARPLGIRTGVEPSAVMRRGAVKRGIHVVEGTAEQLPFPDKRFEAALMVTTICFVDDPKSAVREMYRVLRPGGCGVVGFVDRASFLGREYERKSGSSIFYKDAQFYTSGEVCALLSEAGFTDLERRQTVFCHPENMQETHRVEAGYGRGAFVVVRGWKPRGNGSDRAL
ncbi:MAG: methyltransferase domain-containing protein [Kiritimatiellia bacterium]